ncbi:hypothetical protein BJ122_102208 [Rhodopseudomonas faecalis]|uniref:Uncharacterized protein n=1 Tax=Rhodopseudomonas faecalis TaxID=99655 RepID=A0A318TJD2_9BRAD|nr:hypothetical protein BJ122_102208 [Rhodopseudomonas faecalis]
MMMKAQVIVWRACVAVALPWGIAEAITHEVRVFLRSAYLAVRLEISTARECWNEAPPT